ncbi:MAG: TRAP transporter substrate-binding protein DctP [Dehalobacterium sp.]
MKKKVLVISLMLLLVIGLVGCGSSEPAQTEPAADTSSSAPADTPMFNLKMTTHLQGDQCERTIRPFTNMVNKLTNGTVKIELYSGGTLMPVPEILNNIRNGSLDMAMLPEGQFAGVVPVSEIAGGIAYAFDNINEAWIFMWHRGFIDKLRQGYAEFNDYVIPWEVYSTGMMSKMPVNTMEDMKGKKLRAQGGMSTWMQEAGVAVTQVPGTELYTALSTGVIDGACWADAGPMYEMKFHEVLKNYMLPEPVVGAWNTIHINLDVWKKMTPQQQLAVETAAIMSGRVIQEQTRTTYGRALNFMTKSAGVNVNVLSEAEQAKARAFAEKSWETIAAKDPLNKEVIDMIKEFQKESDDSKQVLPIVEMPW